MTTKLKTPLHLPVELAVEPSVSASYINAEFGEVFPKGIYNAAREALRLGDKIGVGGEGTVYHIEGHDDLVAKIYHEPLPPGKAEKLIVLAQLGNEHLFKMAAWPVDVLWDRPDGNVIGFVMKKIGQASEVHALHSPKSRLKKFPEASWAFLLHVAANIARAVATMHEHGFVIGDLNPKNILVTRQATVYLLDCDSLQFAADGKTYRCGGGFPEYTPPELQGLPFAEIDRTPEHDGFGLAVVIFQLLFLGRHPFSGRYLGAGEMSLEQAIREFRFAYDEDAATRNMQPPPGTLSFAAIPTELRALFRRAFLAADRPHPAEWLAPLERFSQQLQTCALHNGHHYSAELSKCPWCDLEVRAGLRLFNFKLEPQRQAPFVLEELWGEIATLGQIQRLPQHTNVSVTKPSEDARNYMFIRNVRFWLAITVAVLTGGFIAWAGDLPVAFWFLFFAGSLVRKIVKVSPNDDLFFFQRLLLGRSKAVVEPLSKRLHAAKNAAESRVRQLEQQLWGKPHGENEYHARIKELRDLQQQYETLEERRAEKLRQAGAKAHTQALTNYLKHFAIEDSGLVSATMAQWMRAKGVATAADLVEKRIRKKGIVNEYHVNRLLAWRQQLEAKFARDPMRYLTPEDRLVVEQQLNAERQRLEDELLTRTHTLRILKQQIEARRQQMLPTWASAKFALTQAETDLDEVAKENRLAPVYVTLALAFVLVSGVENFVKLFPPPPVAKTVSSGLDDRVALPDFDTLAKEGTAKMKSKDYRAAYERYADALATVTTSNWDLKHTRAFYQVAYAQKLLGETEEAIRYLEKQLRQFPAREKDRLHLVILHWMKGNDKLARKHYQHLDNVNRTMAASLRQLLNEYNFDLEAITP
jgi:DNA-binding helix-hairpin-helix protein with protein kinase domain